MKMKIYATDNIIYANDNICKWQYIQMPIYATDNIC